MDESEVKAAWSRLTKTGKKAEILIEEFAKMYHPNEDGNFSYNKDFDVDFEPLEIEHNEITYLLMREVLKRELGENYKGLYIAAGIDDFCMHLGGHWTIVDRAYNNKIAGFSVGETPLEAEIITHDFMSGISDELEKEIFDASLVRHPYGNDKELIKIAEYTPPESEVKAFSPEWWDMYLLNCTSNLRAGGILLSEFNLQDYADDEENNNTKKVIENYFEQLELADNLLGLGARFMPFLEYRERANNTEPMLIGYWFYRKAA